MLAAQTPASLRPVERLRAAPARCPPPARSGDAGAMTPAAAAARSFAGSWLPTAALPAAGRRHAAMLTLGINSAHHDSAVALLGDGGARCSPAPRSAFRASSTTAFRRGPRSSSSTTRARVAHGLGMPLPSSAGIARASAQAYMLRSVLTGRIPFTLRSAVDFAVLFGQVLYWGDGSERQLGAPGRRRHSPLASLTITRRMPGARTASRALRTRRCWWRTGTAHGRRRRSTTRRGSPAPGRRAAVPN